MKTIGLIVLLAGGLILSGSFKRAQAPKARLSEYGFFSGVLSDQVPAEGIIPYSLNTPLFSDYAEKSRFLVLPPGARARYNPKEVFDFPVGTTLIKTFYFPNDFRNPSKGKQLIETRLLIHETSGWKALTYVWDKDQKDAHLEVAGETVDVSYTYLDGKKYRHKFLVPNLNQCKGCHSFNEKLLPIGPSARQLNGPFIGWAQPASEQNQLLAWKDRGILDGLPDLPDVGKVPAWHDPGSGTLNERARAWLDINCAHCHRPEGPANTSGLNLSIHNVDSTLLGINKTPVAAGRGSGGRKYDITKGKPDESILLYRMESKDPGVMMPELGRTVSHREGIEVIKAWIKAL